MFINGKCTMICRVPMSIHSFFIESPSMMDRIRLIENIPDTAYDAASAAFSKFYISPIHYINQIIDY